MIVLLHISKEFGDAWSEWDMFVVFFGRDKSKVICGKSWIGWRIYGWMDRTH